MNTHNLFASAAVAAVFAFGAPAHAQLLGGAARGALGGAIGGGFGPAGGGINGNGWGMMSSSLPGGSNALRGLRKPAVAGGQSAKGVAQNGAQRKGAVDAVAGKLAGKGRDATSVAKGSVSSAAGNAAGAAQHASAASAVKSPASGGGRGRKGGGRSADMSGQAAVSKHPSASASAAAQGGASASAGTQH